MALTYTESDQLGKDPVFIGRVKVACLNFANYILGEAASTPAHNTRYQWAQQTYKMPDTIAQQVTPPTVQQSQVQTDGSAILDSDLQTAVETTVNEML